MQPARCPVRDAAFVPCEGREGVPTAREQGGAAKTHSWARCSERLGRQPAAHLQGLWLRAAEREWEGGVRPGKAGASCGGDGGGRAPLRTRCRWFGCCWDLGWESRLYRGSGGRSEGGGQGPGAYRVAGRRCRFLMGEGTRQTPTGRISPKADSGPCSAGCVPQSPESQIPRVREQEAWGLRGP